MANPIFRHQQYQEKQNPHTQGWSYKNGYENAFDTNVYPIRGIAVNKDHELKLRLQMNLNDLINSNKQENGFLVSLNKFLYTTCKI